MSTMKKIAQLLALSLAAVDGNMDNMFMSEQEFNRRMNERNALKCGQFKNFPKGTYCKLAGHRVSRFTPAYKCENFEFNDNKNTEK